MNRIVARFADGHMVKGMTADFFPAKDLFHVIPADTSIGETPIEIHMKELKALFFVKDFAGNPNYSERKHFDPENPPTGRPIKVEFKDGEVLVGTTTGYQPSRAGFFVVPADADSNNERCYVVAAATEKVGFM